MKLISKPFKAPEEPPEMTSEELEGRKRQVDEQERSFTTRGYIYEHGGHG